VLAWIDRDRRSPKRLGDGPTISLYLDPRRPIFRRHDDRQSGKPSCQRLCSAVGLSLPRFVSRITRENLALGKRAKRAGGESKPFVAITEIEQRPSPGIETVTLEELGASVLEITLGHQRPSLDEQAFGCGLVRRARLGLGR
jgi:hypothetical protein